jgi:hypothetical protein
MARSGKNGSAVATVSPVRPTTLMRANVFATSTSTKRVLANVAVGVLNGTCDVREASTTCNTVGKILKIVEMEFKMGGRTKQGAQIQKRLQLLS